MLRNIFVSIIIAVGIGYAIQGPFYALQFYLWNAYFRPEQWVYGNTVGSLNLSFLIGIYLVAATALSVPRLRLNVRTGLVVLFFLQTLLSTVSSEHFETSWAYLLEFSKVLLVSYLIVVLVDERRRFRITMIVIALSLGFECAKQGWAQLIVNPGGMNNNPIPFLGDNNGVAVGTMMLVPLLGSLAQTASRRWEKYLYRFFAVGVFLRGFTTYSRGGFLAAAALGLMTLIRSERKIRTMLAMGVVIALVWNIMPPVFWDRMQTITTPVEAQDDSARGRLHFWSVAIQMANANPLTGVGLDAFSQSYESYNTSEEFSGVRSVHSVWFGALAELGYPGFLLYLTIWFMAIVSCWRVSRAAKRDPSRRDLRLYANALMTSMIVFAVAGTFLAMQYNEMLWHFVSLSTALQIIAQSEVRETAPSKAEQSARVHADPVWVR